MGRGVFFQFRWATDWLQSRCRSCPRTLTMCVSGRGEGVSKGVPLANRIAAQQVSSLKPCEGAVYFEQSHGTGMHVGIEVVTEGSPLETGSAEGESLRKKVRSSPTCSRSCTVFGCCSHLDVLSVVPPGFRKPSQTIPRNFAQTRLSRGASSDEGDRTEKPGMRGPKPLVAH